MNRWLRVCLWVGVLLCACPVVYAQASQTTYLVVIGNNVGAADEVELLYAERDARQVAQVFQELGRVRGEHILLLTGESDERVRTALLALNARIRADKKAPARLLVYYSGHADAEALHLGRTRLAVDELKAIVSGSAAQVRLLLIDACRSGAVTRVKGVRKAPEFALTMNMGDAVEGTAILTSSTAGENSQESDRLRGSFFTHHFLSGLRGAADADKNGVVTLTEAYRYSYRETIKSTGRSLEMQHPTFDYGIRGKGAVPLSWPLQAQRSTGRLRIRGAGHYLITEGAESGPVAMDVSVEKKGAVLALPQRHYVVQKREAERYLEYRVKVLARSEVTLEQYPHRTLAYDRLLRKGGGAPSAVHGIQVLAGGQGATISGTETTPVVSLGYSLDLRALSLGLLGRVGRLETPGTDGLIRSQRDELAMRLTLQRYLDLQALSISLGLFVEGIRYEQSYSGAGDAPARVAYGAGFGGVVALERRLFAGVSLRVEAGPVSHIFKEGVVTAGEVVDTELRTPLTWWMNGGLVIRL